MAGGTISTSLPTRSKRIVTMFRGRSIAMCREESFHCKAERKRVGIGYAYRLFKLDRVISSSPAARLVRARGRGNGKSSAGGD